MRVSPVADSKETDRLPLPCRVWEASEATLEDIEQVSMATRHHLQNTLGKEANIAWHKLETACLETPYSEIRDSQFKEIDGEGSLYQAERILYVVFPFDLR